MSRLDTRFLVRRAFADATQTKYKNAVTKFRLWCRGRSWNDYEDLDDLLTQYIHILFANRAGKGRDQAVCTVFGLCSYNPRLKPFLSRSLLAIRGWGRIVPGESHPPLTWALTALIALKMVVDGYFREAVITLVAFDCLLRSGESTNLRAQHVIIAGRGASDVKDGVVSLALVKTKAQRPQYVEVRDPEVARLLKLLVDTTPGNQRLCSISTQSYRKLFRRTLRALNLSDDFVPHSLRHGGATRMYLEGATFAEVKARGRWSSDSTVRRYLQTGPALLAALQTSTGLSKAGKLVASDLVNALLLAFTQRH